VFIGTLPQVGRAGHIMLDRSAAPGRLEAAHDELAAALTNTVQQTSEAEEYLVLDLQERVRLATVQEHEGTFLPNMDFFKRGDLGTSVQNTYVSSLINRPTITVATPLFADAGRGRRVDVLAANLARGRIERLGAWPDIVSSERRIAEITA
jgi:hypothetical protein